jgi:hypothetical protein
MIPKNASHEPIDEGSSLRPPRYVGVERNSGKRALKETSRKASMA